MTAEAPSKTTPWWLAPACAAAAVAWFVWPTLIALSRVYRTDGNFSHGFLIPVLVGYAIWHRRDRILGARPGGFHRLGVFPLLFGVVLVVFARWYEISLLPRGVNAVFLAGTGLLAALVGGCCLLLGPSRLRQLAFPVGFLVFMVPLFPMPG